MYMWETIRVLYQMRKRQAASSQRISSILDAESKLLFITLLALYNNN